MQRKDTNLDLIREKFEEIITALESKYSHTLQDWIGKSATDNTFEESVSDVNRIIGLNLVAMQSESIATKMSEKVETLPAKRLRQSNRGQFFCGRL